MTFNVKREWQNRRVELTDPAETGESQALTCTGPGLTRQESLAQHFGQVWKQTDSFVRSKPGPLAGNPDPLLTLTMSVNRVTMIFCLASWVI